VSAVPELLQAGVVGGVEVVTLEQRVQFAVLALVESDRGASTNDRLAASQQFGRTQRPQERNETIDVTDLLQRVTQTRYLLAAESHRRRRLLLLLLMMMIVKMRQLV